MHFSEVKRQTNDIETSAHKPSKLVFIFRRIIRWFSPLPHPLPWAPRRDLDILEWRRLEFRNEDVERIEEKKHREEISEIHRGA